ncbi:MAG TPA: hypothetical protein ENJ84_03285 [Gammaproteobacteria bacterium]|nr:hypothetical protein [Gammaproteobacteria bacterium]
MLDRIRLHLHSGGKDGYQGFVELQQSGYGPSTVEVVLPNGETWDQPCFEATYAVVGGEDAWDDFLTKIESPESKTRLFFLSLHLKQVVTGPLHDHYDYDSPWCFPVAVKMEETWSIERSRKTLGGEVPKFRGDMFKPDQLGASYGIEE